MTEQKGNKISPDFIGDNPETMKEGTIEPKENGCGGYINARLGITCGNKNYGSPLCDECQRKDNFHEINCRMKNYNINEEVCECQSKNHSSQRIKNKISKESYLSSDKTEYKLREERNSPDSFSNSPEESLSSKKYFISDLKITGKVLLVEDVKEFIKNRNSLDHLLHMNKITWNEYCRRRDELAGRELLI